MTPGCKWAMNILTRVKRVRMVAERVTPYVRVNAGLIRFSLVHVNGAIKLLTNEPRLQTWALSFTLPSMRKIYAMTLDSSMHATDGPPVPRP